LENPVIIEKKNRVSYRLFADFLCWSGFRNKELQEDQEDIENNFG
jgi:hypothetical protein